MNKTKIKSEIVAHSLNPQGDELISVLATFPRIILAEVNTHRMLSKNTSSSRAIPFNKMVEAVQNDPFIPIAWQKDHSGMQGNEYITDEEEIALQVRDWNRAKRDALGNAQVLNANGVTKQLCNRLLEPFMWTTMLITGSGEDWDNFFKLRCPRYGGTDAKNKEVYFRSKKDCIKHLESINVNTINLSLDDTLGWLKINKGQAEIHMMALAECIWDAVNESTPKQLEAGEWHISFRDKIKITENWNEELEIKIATAMVARVSYIIVENDKEFGHVK